MNAIRQILKVENHRVTVQLPDDFGAESVEVIVLPAAMPLTKLQRLILEAPAMTDEEYEFVMEKRRARIQPT